jgi:hypothetical protein
MSWQRILETARRRGLPLIVTDIAGRDPMVILPFEQYERMSDGVPPVITPTQPTKREVEAFAAFETEELQKAVDQAVAELSDTQEGETGLSLEEKFYLEPVDDERS